MSNGRSSAGRWQGGRWAVDGVPAAARIVTRSADVAVFWGNNYHFRVPDPLARGDAAGASGDVIEAPMPGQVKAVFAEAGAAVEKGTRLAVLEAMKMEHALVAVRDGVVAEVLVSAGAQVEAGAALIRLEEEG